jgi:hypothetical protein
MYQANIYAGWHGIAIHAMSGIDMALWDIKGKVFELPVWKLLGGGLHGRGAGLRLPGSKGGIPWLISRENPQQQDLRFGRSGDSFDAFNHPNYGQPNSTIGSTGAGTISFSQTNRGLQLGGILRF